MSYSEWHSLGEVPYRKFTVYDKLGWDESFRIDDYVICGSTFGGPLALLKEGKKGINGDKKETQLLLYTASGNKLAEIEWDHRKICGMGWCDREELVVVVEDGKLRTL